MPHWVKCGHVEPNDARECVTCLKLEIETLKPIVAAAVDLVKWHGAGAIKGDRYVRLFSVAGNYHLKTMEKPKPEPQTTEDLLGECRECNRLVRDCGNHGPVQA